MRFSITVTKAFHARLKAKAENAGMGISEYVRYVLNYFWETQKGK